MTAEPVTRTPSALDELSDAWLETMLEHEPEWHVELGRPGREGEYSDLSPDGHQARADATRAMLARVDAATPADPVDGVTKLELQRVLGLEIEQHDAGFWRTDLNVIESPVQNLRAVFDLMPTDTVDDWSGIALRLRNLPAAVDGYLASLQAGIDAGDTPAVRQVQEVADQASRHADADGFFATLVQRGTASELPASLVADLEAGAVGAAQSYDELVRFLREELAPHAREKDAVGPDVYALASRGFVGTAVDLDETYEWGLDELGRMVAEQESIAREIVPGGTVDDAVAHLDGDPSRRLHGTDDLQAWMQRTSDRVVDELGRSHFHIPEPMRRLECLIAPTQEGGIYYTPPSEDFARSGRMWWSVPEGITEFSPWRELTTVFHEGVPGHHLQCGLAVWNRADLNAWRRSANWNSGHGEGWALYAERLMADLGYLDDPADRLGMLDGQRMRAARVVLDIGVHLEKRLPDGSDRWTGDMAFGFMARHANLNEPLLRFEANRYLGWPGQAPSYKVGQRLWEQVRDDAHAAAGGAWDVKEFHRRALALGSVGLGTLRAALLS
ncbi:DUF885 domain-containing protein [Aeromicrobium sp.]|uniref:DUF885 domain-containing protein n=1 Tax=Aeromicrobium sp. TaxID=1871063 RepID=UPI003D6B09F3